MKMKISPILMLLFLSLSALLFMPKKAFAAVTLSLTPTSKTVSVNDSFETNIILDTGGQTISGGSAVLVYDPTKLQVIDANPSVAAVQVGPGIIFTNPITNYVDTVNGKITLDYGQSAGSYAGTSGNFGKITFKALTAGSTGVSFLLASSGTSTASAIFVAGGSNVLAAANSGNYTISSSVSSISGTPTPTSSVVLPQSGTAENTIFVLLLGLFIFSGGLVLAKIKV